MALTCVFLRSISTINNKELEPVKDAPQNALKSQDAKLESRKIVLPAGLLPEGISLGRGLDLVIEFFKADVRQARSRW